MAIVLKTPLKRVYFRIPERSCVTPSNMKRVQPEFTSINICQWIYCFSKSFRDDHAALFEISVSRSRNLLHRCYGRVKYAPYAMPCTTFYASQKHFQQQYIQFLDLLLFDFIRYESVTGHLQRSAGSAVFPWRPSSAISGRTDRQFNSISCRATERHERSTTG